MAGELGGLLTRKATVLFKIEGTTGVNPTLDPEVDALEVSEPEWTAEPTILERDYVANDLSPFEGVIGRIIAGFQFTTELKGNGRQKSGLVADAPVVARMIAACGYQMSAMTAGASCHGPVVPDKDNPQNAPKVTFVPASDATSLQAPVLYTIEVVTAGASGTAEVLITSNSEEDEIAAPVAQVITSGTSLELGAKGGATVPTWTGNLVDGMKWQVPVFPVGVKLTPNSNTFSTGTIEMNRDGIKMEGNAALGNFSITATAGEIARITFNFTTTYVDPVDEALPDVEYDGVIPPLVELSTFTWGGNQNLLVEQWTLESGNDVQARPSVNHLKGYFGSRITARAPQGGFNPEATREADHPFWEEFTKSKSKTWLTRIGTEVGNSVAVFSPRAMTSEQSFGDRNGILTYEKSFLSKRLNGDDELMFVFY